MKINWDEWRGQSEEFPSMLIKRLLWIPVWRRKGKWLSIRVDLHKMIHPDAAGCCHTHPAYAVRIILKGGYFEEVMMLHGATMFRLWEPGQIGLVRPSLCHLIYSMVNGPSYSLWIRGPVCADVELRGHGWQHHKADALSDKHHD